MTNEQLFKRALERIAGGVENPRLTAQAALNEAAEEDAHRNDAVEKAKARMVEVRRLAANNQPIAAIREYRSIVGCSLLEAKNFVDSLK